MNFTYQKLSIVMLFLFMFSSGIFAQNSFEKGDKIGQLGIGYGFAGIYGDASVPPISVGLQFGIADNISVGGLAGFTTSSYDLGSNYSWTYTYILVGARGEYHFLKNKKDLDAYAGATVGFAITSVSEPSGYSGFYSAGTSYAVIGVHGGVRYYVSPKFAVFGEVGYGVGYINVGVAYKF
jgi:hypothetical protein